MKYRNEFHADKNVCGCYFIVFTYCYVFRDGKDSFRDFFEEILNRGRIRKGQSFEDWLTEWHSLVSMKDKLYSSQTKFADCQQNRKKEILDFDSTEKVR